MTFKNILVALDGTKNSQIAADYGFWIASKLNANLSAQHVVDPRLVSLFVEPEFAEELGMISSIETSEIVFNALRKIGKLVLKRFSTEAQSRGFQCSSKLSEGRIVEEILRYAQNFDLLVVGHRGCDAPKTASNIALGSVAERLVVSSPGPVLIAVQPLEQIEKVVVAYDGSDAAIGALLMAENFARYVGAKLKAVIVTRNFEDEHKAKTLVEEGESLLREYWPEDVFSIKSGSVSNHILEAGGTANSLLILGAYGFKDPNETVLGSTTLRVIRETQRSVLIYKPIVEIAKKTKPSRIAISSH